MDHYKVLGLNRNATKPEIKEAFRKLALKFHPDKHTNSPKHVKDGATLKFKQISEAYGVLIDDRKRADYNLRSSSSTTAGGHGGSRYGGGGHGSGGYSSGRTNGGNYRYEPKYKTNPSSSSSSAGTNRFEFHVDLGSRTNRRSFLFNLAFASILFVGSILIEKIEENFWKMPNSEKPSEEAVESSEKTKKQEQKR